MTMPPVRRVSALAVAAVPLALSCGVAQASGSAGALPARGVRTAPASASGRTIGGQVPYGFRACSSALVSSQAPVPGAELFLRPATGRAITARLDGRGRFTVVVPNALPVKAWLVLSDSRLSVAPLDPAAGTRYAGSHHGTLMQDAPDVRGAIVFGAVEHEPTARWTYGEDLTAGVTHYDRGDRTIVVGSVPVTTAQGEWEPWALLHEYAHHVLHVVAEPNVGSVVKEKPCL